jgi:hypothetical protein
MRHVAPPRHVNSFMTTCATLLIDRLGEASKHADPRGFSRHLQLPPLISGIRGSRSQRAFPFCMYVNLDQFQVFTKAQNLTSLADIKSRDTSMSCDCFLPAQLFFRIICSAPLFAIELTVYRQGKSCLFPLFTASKDKQATPRSVIRQNRSAPWPHRTITILIRVLQQGNVRDTR